MVLGVWGSREHGRRNTRRVRSFPVVSGMLNRAKRTGKRSRCCGFAEVLGLSRAELSGTNIGCRDFKRTAWSFATSLTKWEPLTRPDGEILRETSRKWQFGKEHDGPPQAGSILGSCQVGPPQAGSILLSSGPAAGGLDFRDVSSDGGPPQAGSILEYMPAAGGLGL